MDFIDIDISGSDSCRNCFGCSYSAGFSLKKTLRHHSQRTQSPVGTGNTASCHQKIVNSLWNQCPVGNLVFETRIRTISLLIHSRPGTVMNIDEKRSVTDTVGKFFLFEQVFLGDNIFANGDRVRHGYAIADADETLRTELRKLLDNYRR